MARWQNNKKDDSEFKEESKVKGKRKPNRKERRSAKKEERHQELTSNLPEWYAGNVGLLRDSASFPFSMPVGLPVNMQDAGGNFSLDLPGIATMHLLPGISRCEYPNSAFNVAMNACFQYIRKVNAGAKNYEAPDLGVYLICMGSMISFITYLTRLYGMAMLYDSRNRYFPKYVVEAQHVNYDSIVGNLAEFRLYINMLVAKVSSLPLPATMPYFKRLAFVFQNYYMEGQSIKDQIYMYIPAGFFKLDYDNDQAGMAKMVPLDYSGNKFTYTDLVAYGNNMVDALIYDTDISIIGGDMRKAYSDSQLIQLADIPVDYKLLPLYDPWFNYQFKNATVLGASVTSIDNVDVIQNAAKTDLIYTPYIKYAKNAADEFSKTTMYHRLCGDRLLTIDSPEPDPAQVIESTRLMTAAIFDDSDATYYKVHLYPGAEIATRINYWTLENGVLTPFNSSYTNIYNETTTELSKLLNLAMAYSRFKYLPPLWLFRFNSGWTVLQGEAYLHSIDNFTVLTNLNLQKLHDVAMISMTRVEDMAMNG